jgi:hypothetical protein
VRFEGYDGADERGIFRGEGRSYEEDGEMAASLLDVLGDAYDVRCPRIPD